MPYDCSTERSLNGHTIARFLNHEEAPRQEGQELSGDFVEVRTPVDSRRSAAVQQVLDVTPRADGEDAINIRSLHRDNGISGERRSSIAP